MNKATIRDVDVQGKRVLVRVDFNVPLDNQQRITDDTRIRAALPTIRYLLEHGAAVILMSHLGRPDGQRVETLSLKPVATRLSHLLGQPVALAPDCIGAETEQMAKALQPGGALLLENLRFHKEEEKNDAAFARQLAALGDLYVNDAFGTAHRAHASTEGIAHIVPGYAGFLMEKELDYLGRALAHPRRPFAAVVGGAKISDKIGVLNRLLQLADSILIGGAMANTFLKAKGADVGASLVEDDKLDEARRIMAEADRLGRRFLLPVDVVIADRFAADAQSQATAPDQVPGRWRRSPRAAPRRLLAAAIRLLLLKPQARQSRCHMSLPAAAPRSNFWRAAPCPAWPRSRTNDKRFGQCARHGESGGAFSMSPLLHFSTSPHLRFSTSASCVIVGFYCRACYTRRQSAISIL